MINDPLSRSLEVLEGDVWPQPNEYPTSLIERCYALRKVPIDQLTADDIRLLIGQGIGLQFLMPLAIDLLQKDPLLESGYYPGDLLKSVLGVSEHYWHDHPNQREEVLKISNEALKL